MEKRVWLLAIGLMLLTQSWHGYAMEQNKEDYTQIDRVYITGRSCDVTIRSVDDLTNNYRITYKGYTSENFYWQSFSTLCCYIKDTISAVTVEIPSSYPITREVRVTAGDVVIKGGFGPVKVVKNKGNITLAPDELVITDIAVKNGNVVVNLPKEVSATLEIYAKEGWVHDHMKHYAAIGKRFWRNDYLKIILDKGYHPVTIWAENGIVSLEEKKDEKPN